jgi:hypothetical protein
MLYPDAFVSWHAVLPLNACSRIGLPITRAHERAGALMRVMGVDFPNFVPFKNHILEMILRKLYFQF